MNGAGKAADAGRPADEEMARELVPAFGRPAEAAARHRPAVTVIDPADSRSFLRAAVAGVAVILLLGLLDTVVKNPAGTPLDLLNVLRAWWVGATLTSLAWVGLLVAVSGAIFAATPTDQIAKALIVPIGVLTLADAALKLRRQVRQATYFAAT